MTAKRQAVPDRTTILEETAIHVAKSPSRTYALTDRVGGFWEGQTFSDNEHGGYTISGQPCLRNLLLQGEGKRLSPKTASAFIMHPHQAEHLWPDKSRMVITPLLEQHGMIIELFAESPKTWAVDLDFHHVNESLQTSDEHVLYRDTETNVITGLTMLPEAIVCLAFGHSTDEVCSTLRQLAGSPRTFVEKRRSRAATLLLDSYVETNDRQFNKALSWAKLSSNELVVTEFGKGIWAGLPWFHQGWGRDTFISLPGTSLVTGQFNDAADIIRSFAQFQITDPDHPLYGRVPNRVCSATDIIYNTTDGTPWLIREIAEYILMTGNRDFAQEMFPVMQHAIRGALKNHVDDHGFLTHDDADTWMDAKLEGKYPWSPRGDRAVDIQVLWYTQLQASAFVAELLGHSKESHEWTALAKKVKNSFIKHFVNPATHALFDHLNADHTPDMQSRPNQAFAVTVPLFDDLIGKDIQQAITRQVVSECTYSHGVASLAQTNPDFHPYHHDQIYHFDAAYHNGLCWQWMAGPIIGCMTHTGHSNLAYELTTNLTKQLLDIGTPGSLSELVEPMPADDGSIITSGTYSQAWSVAEFVRNFYQDYMGIRINMLSRTLTIKPHLPHALNSVRCTCRLGEEEQVILEYSACEDRAELTIIGDSLRQPLTVCINGKSLSLSPGCRQSQTIPLAESAENLHFQVPAISSTLKALSLENWLQERIISK